jgi:hypothetical protein
MRELPPYASVRGEIRNDFPYRDPSAPDPALVKH